MKTNKEFDDLLETSGMKLSVIAKRIGVEPNSLYRWRQRPEILNSETIMKISAATGIDEKTISSLSLNIARKVYKLQHAS
ncbi:helix-turn-helix domain-containing protein [Lactococcus insecticola]|uniref:HTH cro/C1-type domain-containing protein n=1 Tax=Pseudolactococcus insecticola TaxID=2709158 RepID=A0A6A0B5K3_9LACT|nr:helix-turn-helix transcriptional regulator [Lactococcus insecticola]GFH39821.1 hypothetical protein Hs20B_02190 [Lactococcus insecticola]